MKEKVKVKGEGEGQKVGRPNPANEVVEETKCYERTYEGYFNWLRDRHVETEDLPRFLMQQYANIENVRKSSRSHVVNEALGHALREIRVAIFDDIKAFLDKGYKTNLESGSLSWKERCIGFHGFLKDHTDQSIIGYQLKRHDAAVKANATRKAKKEGGAK